LPGNADEVGLLDPSHRGGWGALGDFGASARSLDEALQCLSDNPYPNHEFSSKAFKLTH